jgi:probable HAF family extracellular repeat protein
MTDLNSLIPGAPGWDLIQANAINDSGWIVGYGTNTAGAQDAFLLRPANPGDANCDGKVDINDLTIVLAHYNQSSLTWQQGDFNGDGKVDINDLTIVLANYNKTFTASPAAVPEPSAVLMLGLAAVSCATALGLARRKKDYRPARF